MAKYDRGDVVLVRLGSGWKLEIRNACCSSADLDFDYIYRYNSYEYGSIG